MAPFRYVARDGSGQVQRGLIQATSEGAAIDRLSALGLSVTKVAPPWGLDALTDFLNAHKSVRMDDLIGFVVQLSNMVGAGITLPNALHILQEQTENPHLKEIIQSILTSIESGNTFSEALSKHPRVFSRLFVNMVRAGEASGNLEDVLLRLAKFTEAEAALRQKITTAMMYPSILLVAGVSVMVLVIAFLLPSFRGIYEESNITLPLPTRLLFGLSGILNTYWAVIGIFIVALTAGFLWFRRTPRGRYALDLFQLHVPVLGSMIQKATIARLTRTLGTLIGNGVPMLVALESTESTVENRLMADVLRKVADNVQKGESISGPLKESRYFPPMVVQMVSVGEESGSLEVMLNKIADYYDLVADAALKRVLSMIEPLFLLVIGGGVGMIFGAIILPIFEMAKNLSHH